jgi:hypothetical protein
MTTTSLTATYKEGDHYVVEAEVDCLHFRYEFTDPDTEKELLWKMLDDEKDGLNPVARYEILDKAQAAIDSGILDNHPGYDWAPYFQAMDGDCDCCCGPAECTVTIEGGPVYANVSPAAEPSAFWNWAAATLSIGAATAPWVLLMLLGRFAWFKAAEWGWM